MGVYKEKEFVESIGTRNLYMPLKLKEVYVYPSTGEISYLTPGPRGIYNYEIKHASLQKDSLEEKILLTDKEYRKLRRLREKSGEKIIGLDEVTNTLGNYIEEKDIDIESYFEIDEMENGCMLFYRKGEVFNRYGFEIYDKVVDKKNSIRKKHGLNLKDWDQDFRISGKHSSIIKPILKNFLVENKDDRPENVEEFESLVIRYNEPILLEKTDIESYDFKK